MSDESVDLRSLTTAELLDGPTVTHMSQVYLRMMRITPALVGSGERRAIEDFGELQISLANLFRDIVEITERFKALTTFMQ